MNRGILPFTSTAAVQASMGTFMREMFAVMILLLLTNFELLESFLLFHGMLSPSALHFISFCLYFLRFPISSQRVELFAVWMNLQC